MFKNPTSRGNIRASGKVGNHAMIGLLAVVSIFGLLAFASCNGDKVSQAEAKAAAAEKNSAELSTKVNAELTQQKARIEELSAQVKAAEERTKKAEAATGVGQNQKTTAKNTESPAESAGPKAAKGPKELLNAVRVHSLAKEEGIALETKELEPALAACDKDGKLGLALCVMPKQTQYSAWFPVLVTWNDGAVATAVEARKVLACLQQQPAVKKDNDSGKNAAELVGRSAFNGACLPQPAK